MKKNIYLLFAILCAGLLTACGEDNEDIYAKYEDWRVLNEQAFNVIKNNSEYTELKTLSNRGSIYYKVLKGSGEDAGHILYTSTVKVYYTGSFTVDSKDYNISAGKVFDSAEYPDSRPATFNVRNLVEGFTTALQFMKEGDRWEVYIPWYLAYGDTGSMNQVTGGYSILPFSMLKFEIEVDEIVKK